MAASVTLEERVRTLSGLDDAGEALSDDGIAITDASAEAACEFAADHRHTRPSSPHETTVPCPMSIWHPRTMSVWPLKCLKVCSTVQSPSKGA